MTIIIAGIIILVFGIWGMASYWWSFLEIMRGLFPFLGVMLGLIVIGAGIRSSIKKPAENGIKE